MNTERKVRVLVAKPGLDGHDRGAALEAARRVFPGEALLAEPGLRVEF